MPELSVLLSPADEAHRFLPEGPRRVAVNGQDCLAWVVIQTRPGTDATGLIRFTPWPVGSAPVTDVPVPGRVGFILPTDRANVVLAGVGHDLELWDLAAGKKLETLATLPATPTLASTVMNDAEVIPGGAGVVFGTKDNAVKEPTACLYLFTVADRKVTVLAEGQTCSNGKVVRQIEGGFELYDIDTPKRNVVKYRLDVNLRTVLKGEVAIDLAGEPGNPDGMVDCGAGGAVIALYDSKPDAVGHLVHVDLALGEVIEHFTVPGSPRVTCPLLWAGDAGLTLVATTAVEGMPAADRSKCPEAGSLFAGPFTGKGDVVGEVVRLG